MPFVGASNRFWPAALDAGLVRADRDPWRAFVDAHVGLHRSRQARVTTGRRPHPGRVRARARTGSRAVVEWLQPAVVCFAGVTGYREAVDPDAAEGEQATRFGGATTYVMPNPSGANAHASRDDLVAHLTAVRDLATTD